MTAQLNSFRCDCGYGTLLERVYCPRCRGRLRPATSDSKGIILTWTILTTVADGFTAPLGLAMVGLESGINTMVRFPPDKPPSIGDKISITVDEDGIRHVET